ncbi:MAG: TIGR03790 family protein [Planctomycetota bacterium]
MHASTIGHWLASTVLTVCLLVPAAGFGELVPEEIAILVNGTGPESEALGRYYAERRGVPLENICRIDLPARTVLARSEWQQRVRPEIARWLTDRDPQGSLRCWVTTWGIPMKIGKAEPTASRVADLLQFLEGEKRRRIQLAQQLVQALDRVANQGPSSSTVPQRRSLSDIKAAFQAALVSAQQRAARLEDVQQRQQASQQIQELVLTGSGMMALERAFARGLDNHPDATTLQPQLLTLRGQIKGLEEARAMIEQTPLDLQHHQLSLSMLGQTHGVFDSVSWINGRLKKIRANETNASFDSELACVLWPDHTLLLWQPNYLHARYEGSPLRKVYPTIMVSRIDAPTLPLCRSLIDRAIEVEAKGLEGVFYLDGRGIAQSIEPMEEAGTLAAYDQSLMRTAEEFHNDPRLKVVYQNRQPLFQAGECPDAALYCGWYAVGNYVDAFDWQAGAVGYHIASYELRHYHQADSNEWCKRMVEQGVCATIGAVQEPYLQSFPRPDQFFPLLREGKHTLVECFALTNPFTSWAVTLIGDPLYRPFKHDATPPGRP